MRILCRNLIHAGQKLEVNLDQSPVVNNHWLFVGKKTLGKMLSSVFLHVINPLYLPSNQETKACFLSLINQFRHDLPADFIALIAFSKSRLQVKR